MAVQAAIRTGRTLGWWARFTAHFFMFFGASFGLIMGVLVRLSQLERCAAGLEIHSLLNYCHGVNDTLWATIARSYIGSSILGMIFGFILFGIIWIPMLYMTSSKFVAKHPSLRP